MTGFSRRIGCASTIALALVLSTSMVADGQDTWNARNRVGTIVGGDWGKKNNWTDGVPNGVVAVKFPDGLAGPAEIMLDKPYMVESLEIDSSNPNNPYTIESDKGGLGVLTFTGTNANITVDNTNTATNKITLPIRIDKDLALTISNLGKSPLAISGVISGSGAMAGLTFDGPGEVVLSGVNTYKGGTKIVGGNVAITRNAALGDVDGTILITRGGVLRGIGKDASVAADRLILLGTTLNGTASTLAGDSSVNTHNIFVVAAKIRSQDDLGLGDDTLTILGRVRLTNGTNDFKSPGGIFIGNTESRGILYLSSDGVLGNVKNNLVLTNGAIFTEASFTSNRNIELVKSDLSESSYVLVGTGNTVKLGGVISGKLGVLIKLGGGTLVLSGTNTYALTAIRNGTLEVSANANLGKGDVTIDPKGVLQVDAPFKMNRDINIGTSGTINTAFAKDLAAGKSLDLTGVVSGGILIKTGTGVLRLANDKNTQSQTKVVGGVVSVAADAALGKSGGKLTLQNNGALEVTKSITTNRPILVAGGKDGGAIGVEKGETLTVTSGISATNGSFTKTGMGTLDLAKGSTSNFGDAAVIKAGTLQVEGVLSTLHGLTNAAGGTVQGTTGTIKGSFDNKGKVVPGGDPGTLTVTDNVLMEAGSSLQFDINAANGHPGNSLGWGLFQIGGRLELLGPETIDLVTYGLDGNPGPISPSLFNPSQSYSWEFAEAAGGISGFSPGLFTIDSSGFLSPTEPGSEFSIVEEGNGLFIDYSPSIVPEPTSLLLLAFGVTMVLLVGFLRTVVFPRKPTEARVA